MIANALIIGFIGAMVYWWGMVQGFFSAAIHLMLTIVAGALALALWEPLVLGVFFDWFPRVAWGVGLLLPFAVILVILRVATDTLVKGNIHLSGTANIIGGGICGALAGIISSGLTVIGVGFLPLDVGIGGYQPYVISPDGRVERHHGGGLLLPVDRQTASFYTLLSTGSLSSRYPLALFQPDLATQAALFRMRNDKNSSVVADPESVSITNHYSIKLPVHGISETIMEKLGSEAVEPGRRLVVVETRWELSGTTFDIDSKVRVPSTQVRLVGHNFVGRKRPRLHAPVGYSKTDSTTKLRRFTAFDNDAAIAYGLNQQEVLTFAFVVPEAQDAQYILVRHLRLELPKANTDEAALIAALGRSESVKVAVADGGLTNGEVGPRQGVPVGVAAERISMTDRLPRAISRNLSTGLAFLQDAVLSGRADVKPSKTRIGKAVRVDHVYASTDQACIRVQLTRDRAQSLLGIARASAAMLERVWLEDDRHQSWDPVGYVWYKQSGIQQVDIDRTNPIRSISELPVSEMGPGDSLYLYFIVPRDDLTIIACQFGSATRQELQIKIPKVKP